MADGSTDAEASSVLPVGTSLDEKFRVERLLGIGGMGAVYEVTHLLTHHRRALKLLHPHQAMRKQTVDRFLREASAAGKIGNVHIIDTFDAGRLSSGEPFLLMELLEGETLGGRMKRSKGRGMAVDEVAEIFGPLCDAVQAAHDAGIVHRDLKPDNVFLSETSEGMVVKVLDFGVSKFDTRHTAMSDATASGAFIGTPAYMSPEQFDDGAEVDAASDVYALGVIAYQALTGRHPYPARSVMTLARKIATAEIVPPSTVRPSLPKALDRLVSRAMEKDQRSRTITARDLASSLTEIAAAKAPLISIRPPDGTESPAAEGHDSFEEAPTIESDEREDAVRERRMSTSAPPAEPPSRGAWLAAVLVVVVAAIGWQWVKTPPSLETSAAGTASALSTPAPSLPARSAVVPAATVSVRSTPVTASAAKPPEVVPTKPVRRMPIVPAPSVTGDKWVDEIPDPQNEPRTVTP